MYIGIAMEAATLLNALEKMMMCLHLVKHVLQKIAHIPIFMQQSTMFDNDFA